MSIDINKEEDDIGSTCDDVAPTFLHNKSKKAKIKIIAIIIKKGVFCWRGRYMGSIYGHFYLNSPTWICICLPLLLLFFS